MKKDSKSSEVAGRSRSQMVTMVQSQFPYFHHEETQSHPEVQGFICLSWSALPLLSLAQETPWQLLASCLLLTEDQPFLGQKKPTVKRLHSSHVDWFWCSHCSAASTFWNGIFPQWWDSRVDTVSLTKSLSDDHLIIIECWENYHHSASIYSTTATP